MQAHDVPLRVMQEQPHMLEVDHVMQALGEFVKQLLQVAVRRDGFRNLQQGPVLLG
jgi:hypothetical protein